jgi:hypothetical protein
MLEEYCVETEHFYLNRPIIPLGDVDDNTAISLKPNPRLHNVIRVVFFTYQL